MSFIRKLIYCNTGIADFTKVAYIDKKFAKNDGFYVIVHEEGIEHEDFPGSFRCKDRDSAERFLKERVKHKNEFEINIGEDGSISFEPKYADCTLVIYCLNEATAKKLVKHFRNQYFELKQKNKSNDKDLGLNI